MSISGLNGVTHTSTASSAAKAANNELKDQFLRLLVTQLQNQDPLSPMDSTNFTSQLAQFSSLEQLTSINEGLETLAASQNSLQNAYIVNLIGKEVGYEGTAANGAATTLYGKVTGVSYDTKGTCFIVDGTKKVALGDVSVIK
jgi:flagellar basal-body rod modification protein FlgD